MTVETVDPTLRETRRLPFGVYAIVALLILLLFAYVVELIILLHGESDWPILGTIAGVAGFISKELGLTGAITVRVSSPQFTIAAICLGIVAMSLAIIGLLRRQRWAWVLTMMLMGVALLAGIWEHIQGAPNYAALLVYVVVVFYLNERSVQRAFARRASE